MNKEIFKWIVKSTFVGLSFFVLFIYTPIIYAQKNSDINNAAAQKDLINLNLIQISTEPINNLSFSSLIKDSQDTNKYLNVDNSNTSSTNTQDIPVLNQPLDSVKNITPAVTVNTTKDSKGNIVTVASESKLQSSLAPNNVLMGQINSNRLPTYSYVPSRLSPEEANKLYMLSVIVFSIGLMLLTNGWLYNLNEALYRKNEEFEFSESVILEQ